MRDTGLEEAQAGVKISRRNISNLRYAYETTLMAKSEEELKSLLMKMKEEWRCWLKAQHSEKEDHGIQSNHFLGNRWGNSGNSGWICFLGSRITADGDCSHEIKRRLPLGRRVMSNLDSILKSRDITFSTEVYLVKAMVFPVVMYGCESWTVKRAERWWIDAFELWCWRRISRVHWTVRRTNQSILQEINPKHSFKDWCWSWRSNIWPPDAKSWLFRKDSDAGENWRQEKETTENE